MDHVTQTSLESMGVGSLDELRRLPIDELSEALGRAAFPPSEKLIAVVVLTAVDDLRVATVELAAASKAMDTKTRQLVSVARYTLAAAVLSLVVAVVAILVSTS